MSGKDFTEYDLGALAFWCRGNAVLELMFPLELIGVFLLSLCLFASDATWMFLGTVFALLTLYHVAAMVTVFQLAGLIRYWTIFRLLFTAAAALPVFVILPIAYFNDSSVALLKRAGRPAPGLAKTLAVLGDVFDID